MNLRELARKDRPRLLVSVRNSTEARAAVKGGAEIVDIKEPDRGSLGKADDAVIREIADTVRSLDESLPISAALGELREWESRLPVLPDEIQYAKLGLSGSAHSTNWPEDWLRYRKGVSEQSRNGLSWVAVIYADWKTAHAPSPADILEVVGDSNFDAVLVDSFKKDGRSLIEIFSTKELESLADRVHEMRLPLAVAGSLRLSDLPELMRYAPEIIAIRTAACKVGNRNGPICAEAVAAFREQL